MIYLVGLICGILNGVFAAGAGQVLVFYLVFVMKLESHMSRGVSISILSISSIIALIGYSKFVNFDIKLVIIISIISLVSGVIGAKLMNKIKSDYLNLISGIVVIVLAIIQLIK
jgi:uncharacterized membrane protein YfcA